MRNLKRVLSLALALVMVLGMMVITTSAADFTDAEEITQTEAVEVLAELGIVQGSNGAFNPNGNFTREAAAKLITYMKLGPKMAEKLAGTDVFTDVAADRWSAKYIGYCANLGYITGVGDGKFNPSGVLKDIELGKLVLCAIGYDAAKYTGANWATAVTVDMIDAGLVDSVTGTAISREDACAMILAGLKKGTDIVTYDVKANGKTVKFDNQNDALLYCAINTSAEYVGKVTVTTAALLNTVYGVTYTANDVDAFGRPAVSYKNGKTGAEKIEMVFADDATLTYTKFMGTAAGKKQIIADLKAAGVKLTETGTDTGVYTYATGLRATIDGEQGSYCGNTDRLADLTGSNVTVQVYIDKDKAVTDIIVVESHAGVVSSFTKANAKTEEKAYIMVDGIKYETEAFAKDDVVLYTKAAGKIVTIEKAESFTGKLTSYTSDGKYTIGGTAYEVSYGAASGFNAASVTAQINKDYVYYLGVDGKIVYGHSVKGEAPVVLTDYALITDTAVKEAKDAFGDTTGFTAHVKATLSDGSNGTFELAIAKATTGANKGKFVYKIGKAETVVAAGTTELTALENNLFTYTAADGEITLASKVAVFTGSETKSGAAWHYVKEEAGKTSTTIVTHGGTVIANESTVFVLKKNNGFEIKTGIAALEDTKVPAGSLIIVDVTYSEKGNTNVAAVVYATGTSFDDASATVGVNDYMYLNGKYVTTVNEKEETVYTATGIKADGSEITVTEANVAEGIYKFNSKNEVDGSALASTKVKVGTIAGTTYQLGSDYVTVNDTTKVVVVADGAALEKGAEVIYLDANADKVVDLVYVVKAAE